MRVACISFLFITLISTNRASKLTSQMLLALNDFRFQVVGRKQPLIHHQFGQVTKTLGIEGWVVQQHQPAFDHVGQPRTPFTA